MSDISPEYDECPTICFREGKRLDEFCDSCEIKVAKDIFKEEAINVLDERYKDEWKEYTFDVILESVLGIANSEDDDKQVWTLPTEILFDTYMSQRNRLKRIDDWNYKQKIKNEANGS